jgi:GNAT superfamily N-acetyltransferase
VATLERMTPDGWERVRDVRLRALTDAPDAFGTALAADARRPPESWRARLAEATAATFLACTGGEDVGMVVGAPYEGREPDAGLFAMWVAPEARGTGVGDALVRAVTGWARAAGHPRLLLDVADDNVAAIRLYARHGFAPTGITGCVSPDRPHVREHQRALDLTS